jgi:diguanylate cyclase (GGDEF)-like protein
MGLRWSPAGAVLLLTALLDGAAAAWVWRRTQAAARVSQAVLLAAAGVWCASYGLELITVGRAVQEFWGDLEYLGTTALPAAWLMFVLEYTGRRPSRLRVVLAWLAVEPCALFLVLVIPATHDLVRSLASGPVPPVPDVRLGPVYWIHFGYTTLLSVAATVVLVGRLLRVSRIYLRQSVVLGISVAVPLAANIASSFDLPLARRYDPTPVAASIGGLVLVWGAFRYRLLDLPPLARTLAFDRLTDPILVVDLYGRIVDRNPAAASQLPTGSAIGAALQAFLNDQVALVDATPAGAEIGVGDDADARYFELVASTLTDDAGRVTGQLVHLRDITARKQAEGRLRHLAQYDQLTQLPNRQLLTDRLAQAVFRSRRAGGRCALLLLDVDRFKLINDSLGHEGGDQVLAVVARRIRAGRRDEDTAARLGGDEFAVLLPEIDSAQDAVLVANRVLAALTRPVQLGEREVIATASIGVAVWPDDASNPQHLFTCADEALYRAKRRGRNRVEVGAGNGQDLAATRVALGAELWHALRRDELRLFFQPIIHIPGGELVGMEALVRWQHPRLGLLGPDQFLPAAEESGLATEIDQWVLTHSCRQATGWVNGSRTVPVSVNVSAQRIRDAPLTLTSDVADALGRTALPADQLILEISERTVIEDPDSLIGELRDLRKLGVGLALDDFGAGHTSLTHLRRLPLAMLKVDRGLLGGITENSDDFGIMSAVVTLAGILGLSVVAEGIERREQLIVLEQLGCALGQGFLLCPPLDAGDAVAYVKHRAGGYVTPPPGSPRRDRI